MYIILVEPTDIGYMTRTLELRGNTLEPYACEIIASYVETELGKYGVHVEVMQQGEIDKLKFVDAICKDEPDIVGFSVLTCNYKYSLKLARAVKRRLKEKVKIVFGGQHPSLDPEEVIKEDVVDFVVFGEGEITFKELVHTIKEGQNQFFSIEGLVYKDDPQLKSKEFRVRDRIENLDILPEAKRYARFMHGSKNWNLSYPSFELQTGVVQVQYSRGCSAHCSFCVTPEVWCNKTKPVNNEKVTFRNHELLIKEIITIRNNYLTSNGKSINFFYFNDVTFNHNRNKMRDLCNAIINSNLHKPHDRYNLFSMRDDIDKYIHWFCLARIGINKEDAKLLADAGCSKIGFGVESFNEKIVKDCYDKSYNFKNISETLKNTDDVGIINRVYIVIGSPWESYETLNEIKEGLLNNPIDQIRVAFAVPYKGSPASKKSDWILTTDNYDEMSENKPVVKCHNLSEKQLIDARQKIIFDFYNSNTYRDRVKNKIERFPFLKTSYDAFDKELKSLSGNRIKILGS